jgi:DNA-directed RNA polymerase specialized sigma24 family protein
LLETSAAVSIWAAFAARRTSRRKETVIGRRCPDQALDRLETVDAELARIVELRAFGGLTIEEAAHVLSVSPSTAKRDWRTAKAWLNRELGSEVRP